ncbi:MAG: YceI family protein [Flammeovirgaceae bacterium]
MNTKSFFSIIVLLFISLSVQAQTTWKVDPSHSKVGFAVSHLVISEVEGEFKTYEASISTKNEDFTGAKISFSVDANSIDTDSEMRDKHLKSEDFFHISAHPKLTFESTKFSKKGSKYVLEGNLTIRGVSKKVKFNVSHGGIAKDGYGNVRAGFKATTQINRKDFGVAWNAKTENGGLTVGEEVDITLKLEFIKQQ